MPIYAYRCNACGHAKDVLQKLSDPVLTTCPACGAEAFSKQVTAAGFQLKGSGWYVTDFRDGGKGDKAGDKAADKAGDKNAGEKGSGAGKAESSDSTAKTPPPKAADGAAAPAPASPAPSPSAPTSAAGGGG
jgi:putative FmdB family regulatory protein